ncbi:hypothetical protein [Candidatus Leptofilum sp.]|uniref:hypothetical protein n=1 Tax=Candidatus Leptofilum sp. TaxID=3241576 RepID=UPI003B5C0934
MQRIIRKLNNTDLNNVSPENIQTITIIKLPFRLCTGALFQFIDNENEKIQVWLENRISIPHELEILETLSLLSHHKIAGSSEDDFLTTALIVNSQPQLRQGELEAIKTNDGSKIGTASLQNPGFRLLNEIIAAHQMVRLGPYVSSMGATWPRMLSERELFPRILLEVVLVGSTNYFIDEETIIKLLETIDFSSFGILEATTGDIRDYSEQQLSELKVAVEKVRKHAFYELKANAITAMLRGDAIVAIVLGCAALEGVHGAFLRLVLRNKIPENYDKFNQFMGSLLREQGFYSLVQLSTQVFMEEEERPSNDELKRCLDGVTIRNGIMHAGIRKTGRYKIRDYSRAKISDGYSGIIAVYRAFESAVESREQSLKE